MIKVNSKEVKWRQGLDIQALLGEMNYTYPKIIVKVNGVIIEPEEYSKVFINDGDVVNVIHLLAGG